MADGYFDEHGRTHWFGEDDPGERRNDGVLEREDNREGELCDDEDADEPR